MTVSFETMVAIGTMLLVLGVVLILTCRRGFFMELGFGLALAGTLLLGGSYLEKKDLSKKPVVEYRSLRRAAVLLLSKLCLRF